MNPFTDVARTHGRRRQRTHCSTVAVDTVYIYIPYVVCAKRSRLKLDAADISGIEFDSYTAIQLTLSIMHFVLCCESISFHLKKKVVVQSWIKHSNAIRTLVFVRIYVNGMNIMVQWYVFGF